MSLPIRSAVTSTITCTTEPPSTPPAIVPNDHWSVLGAAMQKYLAQRSDRAELIASIEDYWAQQQ